MKKTQDNKKLPIKMPLIDYTTGSILPTNWLLWDNAPSA
jgi:hypothetical protein